MNQEEVYTIVDWFLHVMPMTHKKLQKLLYFSYGIYLVQNNNQNLITNRLFENTFEAWVHGPVEPFIYSLFKYNGVNLLYREEEGTFNFNQQVLTALNTTIDLYGDLDADELEDITHQQIPWINARKGLLSTDSSTNRLNDDDIYNTFFEIINE